MSGKLLPGTDFAGYRIERLLSEGGMGTVYMARHPRLPRWDALKILSAEHFADPEFRARFLREADLAARLNHPNIIAVHDRGVSDGWLWIAMQYVPGANGAELVARGPLSAERAVHIVEQAARGLDEAHRAGMVHRDVKPANLLIEERADGTDRVLVSDFGIGRSVADSTALTAAGTVLATLAYAAPEQLVGERVDHRADVYALGTTLYQLLTGYVPFPRASAAEVIEAHLSEPPPRPSSLRADLPPALDSVIGRAMDKDPDRRYPSCGELAAAARAACAPAPEAVSPHRFSRGRRLGLSVAAVAVAAALAAATAVAMHRHSTTGPGQPVPVASATVTTTVSQSSTTSATPTANWGSYAFIPRAFPGLLPASPDAAGYQGIRCAAIDDAGKPADMTVPVSDFAMLACNGDKQPLVRLRVGCKTNREPLKPTKLPDDTITDGSQAWTRPTTSGWMTWGHFFDSDKTKSAGMLAIDFNDSGRSFCELLAFSEGNAQALVDGWWPGVPL
ncbi:serine/threonine-protein kinase [Nocardia concava]|uniref:serine/threonine-protein kinase n=1 Tax=Nocardia concava TaxID=257281 RepID=UPI0003121248|nr:serine/threonine-protein kinase [Nocardia concava]